MSKERVASSAFSQSDGVCSVTSVMPDSATPWTVAHQAPLPMEFSRQEYWNGLPFPPPGDLPNPRIEPGIETHVSHLLHWQVAFFYP